MLGTSTPFLPNSLSFKPERRDTFPASPGPTKLPVSLRASPAARTLDNAAATSAPASAISSAASPTGDSNSSKFGIKSERLESKMFGP